MGMLYLLSSLLCMRLIRDEYYSYEPQYNPFNNPHRYNKNSGKLYARRNNKFFLDAYRDEPITVEEDTKLYEIITDYQIRDKILDNTFGMLENKHMRELSTIFDLLCKLYIREEYKAICLNTLDKFVKRVLESAEKFMESVNNYDVSRAQSKFIHALNDLKYDLTDLAFNKFPHMATLKITGKPKCVITEEEEDLIYCTDNNFYKLVNLYWQYADNQNHSKMMDRNLVQLGIDLRESR